MSLFNTLKSRGSRLIISVAMALSLSACFQPLHAPSLMGQTDKLTRIDVQPIVGYVGHELRNELDFLLAGGNDKQPALYRLTVTTASGLQSAVVDGITGRAQAVAVQLIASYKLTRAGSDEKLIEGTVQSLASYDRTQQRYAALRALRDAEGRAAKQVAELLRARIAAYLHSNEGHQNQASLATPPAPATPAVLTRSVAAPK